MKKSSSDVDDSGLNWTSTHPSSWLDLMTIRWKSQLSQFLNLYAYISPNKTHALSPVHTRHILTSKIHPVLFRLHACLWIKTGSISAWLHTISASPLLMVVTLIWFQTSPDGSFIYCPWWWFIPTTYCSGSYPEDWSSALVSEPCFASLCTSWCSQPVSFPPSTLQRVWLLIGGFVLRPHRSKDSK